jgi:hypothetical protein
MIRGVLLAVACLITGLLMLPLGAMAMPSSAPDEPGASRRPALLTPPSPARTSAIAHGVVAERALPRATTSAKPTKKPGTAKPTPSTGPASTPPAAPAPLSQDEILIRTLLYGALVVLGLLVLFLIIGAVLRRKR